MLRVFFLLAALCVALPAYAQSNGVGKDDSGRRNAAKSHGKPTQDEQPVLPLAVQDAIKRIPSALEAANAKKPSAEDEDRSERNVRSQEQLAAWGPWMFRLGVAEITLTAIGVGLLFGTLKETRSTSRDSALQAKLARQSYIASNRPRLRVRHLHVIKLVEGQPIGVQYEVINVGDTRATVVDNEVTVRVAMSAGDRTFNGEEATITRQFFFAKEVQQGEALIASGEIGIYDPAWGYDLPMWNNWWNGRLFVIGKIRYLDDNGVMRRTAFYQVATNSLNRFKIGVGVDAQFDHEYED